MSIKWDQSYRDNPAYNQTRAERLAEAAANRAEANIESVHALAADFASRVAAWADRAGIAPFDRELETARDANCTFVEWLAMQVAELMHENFALQTPDQAYETEMLDAAFDHAPPRED
jgi:hypothetical protein